MKKHKVLTLLSSFSKLEKKKFLDFVESPYFNKRETVLNFAIYLLKHEPEEGDEGLELEEIPEDVFPLKERSYKALSYLKSELYKLAKQFVAIQYIDKQDNLMEYYTAQGIILKDKEIALKILTKTYDELNTKKQLSQKGMLMKFLVIELLRELYPINGEISEALLQASIDSSEKYYLFNKVGLAWETENRKVIVKYAKNFRNPLMGVIEEYLKKQEKLDPLIAVYFQLYLTTKNNNDKKDFNKLLITFRENSDKIDPDELRTIYVATINAIMRKTRNEPDTYRELTFDFYVEGIRNKALFSDGVLSQWTYKNVVKLGIYLERFDWVENFINDHLIYLSPKARDNAYYANAAELAFAQCNYDLTLELLNKLRTNNFRYYLSTKILRIKVFYEQGDLDAFESNVSTFLIYLLRRKDLAVEVRENCQNFCNMIQHITKMNTEKKKIKISEKLNTPHPLAEKEWLLSVFARESKRMYM